MPSVKLAQRMSQLESSPIREILKVIDRPGMISFAGGLPSPETFPTFSGDIPSKYLQYGPSEGELELRELVSELVKTRGLQCTPEQALILTGSQQGIDMAGKLLIENGSCVAIEQPTYLAALQVFGLYGASYQNLGDINEDTTLAYSIPTFQNPTGHCYTEQERLDIAVKCDQSNVTLFEDDPYYDLAYDPVCRTPICSMLKNSNWIYQGSFSKSLAPGLRLGYMVASKPLMPYLTRIKQAADLHSSRISQYFVAKMLTDPGYESRISQIQRSYREKRDFFATCLDEYFGDIASWELPSGGLFFWITLKDNCKVDTNTLFDIAIAQNVAFMPGAYFFPKSKSVSNSMRLNFSHATREDIVKGLSILSKITRNN